LPRTFTGIAVENKGVSMVTKGNYLSNLSGLEVRFCQHKINFPG